MSESTLQKVLTEVIQQFTKSMPQLLPDSAPADLERLGDALQTLLKKQLDSRLATLDVVSKEEFAAHTQLLNRLKQRVIELEERLQKLD